MLDHRRIEPSLIIDIYTVIIMSLAQEYRALAQGVRDELPEDIKAHIKDNLRNAAQRGKFETLYIVPEKWSNNVEAMKVFFSKNGFSYEFNNGYQSQSFKIKF